MPRRRFIQKKKVPAPEQEGHNMAKDEHQVKPTNSMYFKLAVAIGVGIVLLVLIGYVATRNNQPEKPKPSPQGQTVQTAKVSINPSGFSPQTITLNAGTQLTWANNDSQAHQVAADPHPLDNSIPGFDSTQLLSPNDSYSFTFTKKGTYHYHDHLNPLTMQGTVIVK